MNVLLTFHIPIITYIFVLLIRIRKQRHILGLHIYFLSQENDSNLLMPLKYQKFTGQQCFNMPLIYALPTYESHNLSTRCVRNRFVASCQQSCNNAVILSSCYKIVTQQRVELQDDNKLLEQLVTSLLSSTTL